jgi:acyl-CoA dehydrogenase
VTRYYYRQLLRMSAAFALMTDFSIGTLGGSLKRREKISGRLADALSNMYIISAVLKHFEDEGSQSHDVPLLRWACEDALFNIQSAMKGVMTNFPVPLVGGIMNMLVFPLSKPYKGANDRSGHLVARLLLKPSAAKDRLTRGIYLNDNPDDPTGRIEHALDYVLRTEEIERRLRGHMKKGELDKDSLDIYRDAHEAGFVSEEEYRLLCETRDAVRNAIKVDEFSNQGWKVETP